MYIYVLDAEVDLYRDRTGMPITGRKFYNSKESIDSLSPLVYYRIRKYKVTEERDTYYIRRGDMTTHKVYDPDYEYDYEDEILDVPMIREKYLSELNISMPTTIENLEQAKKTIQKHVNERLTLEIARAQKLMDVVGEEVNWFDTSPIQKNEEG